MREKVLRNKNVCEMLNISTTTLWRWQKAGYFPESRSLPCSSIKGWSESTVNAWITRNFDTTIGE